MIDERIDVPGTIVRRVPDLPASLDGAVRVGPYSAARPGALLRVVPGVGRFAARDGTNLDYCVDPGADAASVQALLHGGVLGALIHQRGELPLHATTLVSPDRTFAVALAGHSGAGKSTTAYELIRRGWILLSDDLTRVTPEGDAALAWPGRSKLRLMRDACMAFGLDAAALAPAPNWPDKFIVEASRWEHCVSLRAVIALERTGGSLQLEVLREAAAVRMLAEQTYRFHYVAALGQTRRHLELVAATAAFAQVIRLTGNASVVELATAVSRATTAIVDANGEP